MKNKLFLITLLFACMASTAQVKVSALPSATSLTGSEQVMILQSGANKKATLIQVVKSNADTLRIKDIGVLKADSNYQKPGSYTTVYDFKNQFTSLELTKAYKGIGTTIKSFPLCPLVFTGGMNLNDGYIYGAMTYFVDSTPLVGIKFIQHTAGVYTADQTNGCAIYKINGTNYDLIAQSANTGTLYTATSNTVVTVPFTAPITVVPGYYMVAELYNNSAQTTQPMMVIANTFMSSFNDLLPSNIKLGWYWAGQNSFPAQIPAASTTKTGNVIGLMTY